MKLATLTLGCKVNVYDTEAIEEIFIQKGYKIVNFYDKADVYIINTCTVTNLGDKKSRQMIRRARKQNQNAIVVATGCYAQTSPDEVSKIEGINLIVGTKDRKDIFDMVEAYRQSSDKKPISYVSDIMQERSFETLSINGLKNRTRAYLKIQEGCNQYCSYCIIPFARGPVRSRPETDIISEVNRLAKNGFKELVLAGIHVASYGKDLGNTSLLEIIKKVHKVDGIERIRFSSIEPSIITKDFTQELLKLNKICHHMHLSLQSGCDKTLRAMNRKYNTKEYKNAVSILREYFKDFSITTDIIVGFPDETDKDFKESYEFCKEIGFSKIHVFPFSPKKGTKAYAMENQINKETKDLRSKSFISLDEELQKEHLKNKINTVKDVLFEKKNDDNIYEGHTSDYVLVKVRSTNDICNKILPVTLKILDSLEIIGEL